MKFKEYIKETTISGNVNTYDVPHASGKSIHKTTIPPNQRSLKNLPRDKKQKPKVKFQRWLGLDKDGWSTNGKCYGYSHRGIFGFKKGYEIKKGDISIKPGRKLPYKIKDDKDAMWHAKNYTRQIS